MERTVQTVQGAFYKFTSLLDLRRRQETVDRVDDAAFDLQEDRRPVGAGITSDARLEPIALLSLLKHPLAAGGLSTQAFREAARLLDREVLRGPRPAAGLDGLLKAIRRRADSSERPLPALHDLADRLERLFRPLAEATAQPLENAGTLLDVHIQTLSTRAEILSAVRSAFERYEPESASRLAASPF